MCALHAACCQAALEAACLRAGAFQSNTGAGPVAAAGAAPPPWAAGGARAPAGAPGAAGRRCCRRGSSSAKGKEHGWQLRTTNCVEWPGLRRTRPDIYETRSLPEVLVATSSPCTISPSMMRTICCGLETWSAGGAAAGQGSAAERRQQRSPQRGWPSSQHLHLPLHAMLRCARPQGRAAARAPLGVLCRT